MPDIHVDLSSAGGVLPPALRDLRPPDYLNDTHGGVVQIGYCAPYDALGYQSEDDDDLPSVDTRIAIITAVLQAAIDQLNSPDMREQFEAVPGPHDPPSRFAGDDAPGSSELDADVLALEALLDSDETAADPFDRGDDAA